MYHLDQKNNVQRKEIKFSLILKNRRNICQNNLKN